MYSNGNHKGFSNEGVSNLLNLGEFGPLDNANNGNVRRDVNNHRMDRVNGKSIHLIVKSGSKKRSLINLMIP